MATDGDSATTLTHVTAARRRLVQRRHHGGRRDERARRHSTAPGGGTAQVVRSVVNDVVGGTLLFTADDPTGDDNGPGTYAYPTAGDFHAGAFDLTKFQVYDTGTTVTFRVQTADLTPTFGSTNGAQLVDVYVGQPGAAATSTASSLPGDELPGLPGLEPPDRGAGLHRQQDHGCVRRVDGNRDGGRERGLALHTFSVDKAALGGTPASGWTFTVTLTGQDGTARSRPDPSLHQHARCSTPSACARAGASSPLCAADPNTVPKVMDTITPTGVTQSDELNFGVHSPVVVQGLPVP